MAALGWVVTRIPWATIGWLLLYLFVRVFVIDAVKRVTYRVLDASSGRRKRDVAMVTTRLDQRPPGLGARAPARG